MELKNRKVDLFGCTYTIRYKDKIISNEDKNHELFGVTNSCDRTITIAKTLYGKTVSKKEIELTLLHELIHAILDSGQFLNESSNEAMVEWVAKCIYQLLKKDVI